MPKITKMTDMNTAIIEGRKVVTLGKDEVYNEGTGLVTDYSGYRSEGDQDNSQDLVSEEMAEILLSSDNQMFRESKKDYEMTMTNKTGNIKYTKGRRGGRSFIKREQINTKEIMENCAKQREFHRKVLASGKDTMKDMGMSPTFDLPRVIFDNILESIFNKRSMTDMTPLEEKKFFHVVNQVFPEFVVHGSGKIPQAQPFAFDRNKLN